jgi:hypothetical protein
VFDVVLLSLVVIYLVIKFTCLIWWSQTFIDLKTPEAFWFASFNSWGYSSATFLLALRICTLKPTELLLTLFKATYRTIRGLRLSKQRLFVEALAFVSTNLFIFWVFSSWFHILRPSISKGNWPLEVGNLFSILSFQILNHRSKLLFLKVWIEWLELFWWDQYHWPKLASFCQFICLNWQSSFAFRKTSCLFGDLTLKYFVCCGILYN